MCGKEAKETYSVTFANGSRPAVFEIDLCAADARKLIKAQDALTAMLEHGRRRSNSPRRASARRSQANAKASSGGADSAAIREWAKKRGYEVSDRGRISAALRDAYAQAK
jgi:hypothetical protein